MSFFSKFRPKNTKNPPRLEDLSAASSAAFFEAVLRLDNDNFESDYHLIVELYLKILILRKARIYKLHVKIKEE